MITCSLTGRLGNQMFQIAATAALAMKHATIFTIPTETINNQDPVYFPELSLYNPISAVNHFENVGAYAPIEYHNGPLCLNGYYQSARYFEGYDYSIRKLFQILLKSPNHGFEDIVAIHVRRGDYLVLPDFPVLGLQYYHNAIHYFLEKGFNKFLVFSDDMEWCIKNINSNLFQAHFFYSAGHGSKPMVCLNKMIQCRHFIIANSTFSWWGAWMGGSRDKIVIAPTTLFKGANKDFIPSDWIKINDL